MAPPEQFDQVLIIDDDRSIRYILSTLLRKNGFETLEAEGGRNGITMFERDRPGIVLLDLKMPDMDGIEALQELRKLDPEVPIIIVTGHGDIPTAVEAIKLGASDFLTKPPEFHRLMLAIEKAIEKRDLETAVKRLDTAVDSTMEWSFGKSQAIKNVIQQVRQVAWTGFSVIIEGDTGTGKSVVARTIHNLSKRADKPFVTVDMGTIPENLAESQLFGYEKGAFTGADRRNRGFFEVAEGGTVFIDELENMSPYVQIRLLRFVEEKLLYPLGSTKPVMVDVRIIAASNKDIRELVRKKQFREDLFYRLSEFIITVPPLKERPEDIEVLARRFFAEAATELNKPIADIDETALNFLKRYPWPGNVRELKNVVRRAVLMADNGFIGLDNINFLIEDKWEQTDNLPVLPLKEVTALVTRDAEKAAIEKALRITGGNKTKAASMLEIDYKTLLTKIKEYRVRSG